MKNYLNIKIIMQKCRMTGGEVDNGTVGWWDGVTSIARNG